MKRVLNISDTNMMTEERLEVVYKFIFIYNL
jgi:hypothetical protein